MSTKNDGGPAFPVLPPAYGENGIIPSGFPYPDTGMTLRDYFAAKAMQAQQTAFWSMESAHGWSIQEIANESYAMADAMLKAREQ